MSQILRQNALEWAELAYNEYNTLFGKVKTQVDVYNK